VDFLSILVFPNELKGFSKETDHLSHLEISQVQNFEEKVASRFQKGFEKGFPRNPMGAYFRILYI